MNYVLSEMYSLKVLKCILSWKWLYLIRSCQELCRFGSEHRVVLYLATTSTNLIRNCHKMLAIVIRGDKGCSHISRAYCKKINHSHTYLGVCTWLPSLSFYYFHPWYEWRCLIAQLCWIHWIAHTGNGISSLMSHSLTLLQFKQSSGVIQEQVTPKIMLFFLGLPRTSIGTCAL